jgi:hypothetical protein
MPFDTPNTTEVSQLAVLQLAKTLLQNGQHLKGIYYETHVGKEGYCLAGAYRKAYESVYNVKFHTGQFCAPSTVSNTCPCDNEMYDTIGKSVALPLRVAIRLSTVGGWHLPALVVIAYNDLFPRFMTRRLLDRAIRTEQAKHNVPVLVDA